MNLNRRDAVKGLVALGATLTAPPAITAGATSDPVMPGTDHVMFFVSSWGFDGNGNRLWQGGGTWTAYPQADGSIAIHERVEDFIAERRGGAGLVHKHVTPTEAPAFMRILRFNGYTMDGDEKCPECDGAGEIAQDGRILTCRHCDGEGWL